MGWGIGAIFVGKGWQQRSWGCPPTPEHSTGRRRGAGGAFWGAPAWELGRTRLQAGPRRIYLCIYFPGPTPGIHKAAVGEGRGQSGRHIVSAQVPLPADRLAAVAIPARYPCPQVSAAACRGVAVTTNNAFGTTCTRTRLQRLLRSNLVNFNSKVKFDINFVPPPR